MDAFPTPATPPAPRPAAWLIADWRDFVIFHFSLRPEVLAPHVPFPLDLHEGRAWASLVAFRLERMRPAFALPPALGRALLRPVSDHEFLNLRTYVRGPAGTGIHFLAEWIDNPLSLRLGPPTYGLPYRRARIRREALPAAGLRRIVVETWPAGPCATLVAPLTADQPPAHLPAGSTAAFLLERYRAYTHRAGVGRFFTVNHPPWHATAFQLARFDTTLIQTTFPWFREAEFAGGHLASGFTEVRMGPPCRVDARVAALRPLAPPAIAPNPASP